MSGPDRIRELAALAASDDASERGRAADAIGAMPPAVVRGLLIEALLVIGGADR